MLIEGLAAAVSGLQVSTTRLNQSAHNLANANTTGFVPNRVEQATTSTGGVQVTGTTPTTQGPIVSTGLSLDLSISGNGFYVLTDQNGEQVYSRSASFTVNQDGQVVDSFGRTLQTDFQAPQGTSSIQVSQQGVIQALGSDGGVLAEGQIQTATFGNPSGLEALGGNVYQATNSSGPALVGIPGDEGWGQVVSGGLQASGTDIATEMVNQIVDQRTFEANLRTVRTMDEMVGTVLDLVG